MPESQQKKEQIILFSRYPEPGTTKTRLIAALGAQGAADLQRQLTEHVVRQVRTLQTSRPLELTISYRGGSKGAMERWLGAHRFLPQVGRDLGEKMMHAFAEALQQGAEKALIIGSDCPAISPALLAEALDTLNAKDLVLGPASDGGYYLIGQKKPNPFLFTAIPWGTGSVREKTLAMARNKKLTVHLLETLHDIDRPEDIRHFRHYSGA